MKNLLILTLLLGITITSCKKKQSDAITDAKKNYQDINSHLKDYTKRVVDDITSKEGGTITGYYKDDEIKKMYVQHFGDKSRSFTDYYFDDGMLIYVVKQEFVYNKPNTYTEEAALAAHDSVWYDDRKTVMEVSTFYLFENKLIKWIAPGGKDMAVNDPQFINTGNLLLAEALIAMKQVKED